MKSYTSRRFREAYRNLPPDVRERARKAYRLFLQNPSHPGLSFKKVVEANDVYSVRVGLGYRALGKLEAGEIVWFWIGSHQEYDKRI